MKSKKKINTADVDKLEKALCILVDYEWAIVPALAHKQCSRGGLHDMCEALRALVDDGFQPSQT